ncbi:MAG: 50S ribosomal protein L25 [Dehalococcoidales bacterium]|nr:50S ribosomal protein L25 [Dehalococcoidales bacterium]
MDKFKLTCSLRDVTGKKTKNLRNKGITPIHLFGRNMESLILQCDNTQLERVVARAGRTRPIELDLANAEQPGSVFLREVQRDPIKRNILHADFYLVRKGEKIKVDVPIIFIGQAPALKEKGRILTQAMNHLSIECLPDNIPSQIEVDVTPLDDLNKTIVVKDIALSQDITVLEDPDQLVVKVSEMAEEKVEEVVVRPEEIKAEAAPAEGEAKGEAPKEEQPAK